MIDRLVNAIEYHSIKQELWKYLQSVELHDPAAAAINQHRFVKKFTFNMPPLSLIIRPMIKEGEGRGLGEVGNFWFLTFFRLLSRRLANSPFSLWCRHSRWSTISRALAITAAGNCSKRICCRKSATAFTSIGEFRRKKRPPNEPSRPARWRSVRRSSRYGIPGRA